MLKIIEGLCLFCGILSEKSTFNYSLNGLVLRMDVCSPMSTDFKIRTLDVPCQGNESDSN